MYFSYLPSSPLFFFVIASLLSLLPSADAQSGNAKKSIEITSDVNLGFLGTYPLWLVIGVCVLVGCMIIGFSIVSWRNMKGNPEVAPEGPPKSQLPSPNFGRFPMEKLSKHTPPSMYSGAHAQGPLGSGYIPPSPSSISSEDAHPLPSRPSQPSLLRSRSSPANAVAPAAAPLRAPAPAYILPTASSNLPSKDQRILAWSKAVPTSLPLYYEPIMPTRNDLSDSAHPQLVYASHGDADEEDLPLALSRSASSKKSLRNQPTVNTYYHSDEEDDDDNSPLGIPPPALAYR